MDRELLLLNESPEKCTVEWATLGEYRKLDEFLGSIPDKINFLTDSHSIISGPSITTSMIEMDSDNHDNFIPYERTNSISHKLCQLDVC